MTGVILAGGKSSRMGCDKAFLALEGRPLIEHVLRVFLARFDQTFIVTRDPARYEGMYASVIADAVDIAGPLTGIYTGLLHALTDRIFVAACDMPFIDSRLVAYMEEVADEFDAVVPRPGGLVEPLHAIYHRRTLPAFRDALDGGERKVSSVLRGLRVRYITDDELSVYDPLGRSFRNLNTPEDYKEAVCSVLECRN